MKTNLFDPLKIGAEIQVDALAIRNLKEFCDIRVKTNEGRHTNIFIESFQMHKLSETLVTTVDHTSYMRVCNDVHG